MKIMGRLLAVMLTLVFLSSILVGCGDAEEIDNEVYVLALGIDKGLTNTVRITVQYATYKGGGSGGGGGGSQKKEGGESNETEGAIVHTIEASSILEAIDLYGMTISRRISLKHTKQLVFSEEFAREGVGHYIAPIARYRETRRIMSIAVVKGTAQDFIKENKTNIGESLSKAMELMAMQGENTSYFPNSIFHDFYEGILSTYWQPYTAYAGINEFKKLSSGEKSNSPLVTNKGFLPGELPREGVAKREFVGTALFDGDKMVGSLDSLETRHFLMVLGEFKKGIMTLEDKNKPGYAIPLDIRLSRQPKIKGYIKNGKPVIKVKIEIEGDIGAIQSRIDYERSDLIEVLNKQVEEILEKDISQVIKKTQELNADVFRFGYKIAGSFKTIQEWEKYNWKKHYKEAEIKVNVIVNIRRTGLLMHSSSIKSSKGWKIEKGEK